MNRIHILPVHFCTTHFMYKHLTKIVKNRRELKNSVARKKIIAPEMEILGNLYSVLQKLFFLSIIVMKPFYYGSVCTA